MPSVLRLEANFRRTNSRTVGASVLDVARGITTSDMVIWRDASTLTLDFKPPQLAWATNRRIVN